MADLKRIKFYCKRFNCAMMGRRARRGILVQQSQRVGKGMSCGRLSAPGVKTAFAWGIWRTASFTWRMKARAALSGGARLKRKGRAIDEFGLEGADRQVRFVRRNSGNGQITATPTPARAKVIALTPVATSATRFGRTPARANT
jgi:hypothetical protein